MDVFATIVLSLPLQLPLLQTTSHHLGDVSAYTSGIMSRADPLLLLLLLLLLSPAFFFFLALQLAHFLWTAKATGGAYRNVSPLSAISFSFFKQRKPKPERHDDH